MHFHKPYKVRNSKLHQTEVCAIFLDSNLVFLCAPTYREGDILNFGVDPADIGVGVSVALSCLHNFL